MNAAIFFQFRHKELILKSLTWFKQILKLLTNPDMKTKKQPNKNTVKMCILKFLCIKLYT